jgi:hypothetical protein
VGRQDLAGTNWQGQVAVAGGVGENGRASARLDLYDPVGRRWSRGPDLPAPLHHTALVVLGDRLWLLGGTSSNHATRLTGPRADVWSLGPGETSWRPEAPLTTPRAGLGAAVAGGQIVVAGGRGPEGLLAATELYDPTTATWQPGPDLTQARDHVAMTAVGTTVYALSGQRGKVGDTVAVAETLVLPDGQWQANPLGLEIDRGGATAFVIDGKPCLAGGEPEPYSFIECLETADDWAQAADVTNRRHGLAAVVVGRTVHLIGGGTQSGRFVINDHEVVSL